MARGRPRNLQHPVFGYVHTLPLDLPWSTIGARLVCKECGTAGAVNIVPNWHYRAGHAVHSRGVGKRETQLLKLTADRPFADPEKAARLADTKMAEMPAKEITCLRPALRAISRRQASAAPASSSQKRETGR